jgi:hypothetical protein
MQQRRCNRSNLQRHARRRLHDARNAAWRKQAPSQRNTQNNSISLHPFDTMQHAYMQCVRYNVDHTINATQRRLQGMMV